MIEKTFKIQNTRGVHLRPSTMLAEAMEKYSCRVTIWHHGNDFQGKSILHLFSAMIRQGDEITVVCKGADENEAMAEATAIIDGGFGEFL